VRLFDVYDESGACIFEDQEVLEDLNPQASVCLKKYRYQRGVPIVSCSFLFAVLFRRPVTQVSRYGTCSWLNFQTEINTTSAYVHLVHKCCYLCLLLIRRCGSHLKVKYKN